jgi:cysteine desulfurase
MLYLDHNATTAPAPAVLEAMLEVMRSTWANASSQHGPGQDAKRALGAARTSVSRVLGCKPVEVVFTSGASEANQLALRGLLAGAQPARRRVLFGSVEHAAHLRLARALADSGFTVDYLPVLSNGTLDMAATAARLGPDVALVSLMAANNETGVLMPTAQVAGMAHAAGALFHMDATQWIGKLPFDFASCGADAVSLSAHKFQGPKGVGALLLRQGTALIAQTPGSQERGRRGGTENLPAIAGMAAALELLGDVAVEAQRVAALRDTLEAGLLQVLPQTHVWSRGVARLPGTCYLRFGQLSVDVVLQRLETLGAAASSGAACASTGSAPSHVLTAMGVPTDEALAAVRLSLGHSSTLADVHFLLAQLPPLLEPLLTPYPYPSQTLPERLGVPLTQAVAGPCAPVGCASN